MLWVSNRTVKPIINENNLIIYYGDELELIAMYDVSPIALQAIHNTKKTFGSQSLLKRVQVEEAIANESKPTMEKPMELFNHIELRGGSNETNQGTR